jgi:hypothetical protein
MEENPTEEAFSSGDALKKVITKNEFHSVIKMLEEEYNFIFKFLKRRLDIIEKSKQAMRDAKESMSSHSLKLFSEAVKEAKLALFHTDEVAYKEKKLQFDNIHQITEFLNRFRAPDNYLERLDISFINRLKQKE